MKGNLACPTPGPRSDVTGDTGEGRRRAIIRAIMSLGKLRLVCFCTNIVFLSLTPAPNLLAADVGADTAEIERLIAQLGNEDFEQRELAQTALERIGPPARAALAKARNHTDFEISWRARYLLDRIHVRWIRETDAPEVGQLFERYQYLSAGERIARVQLMRMSPDEVRAVTLARVARFETNESISKLAAVALLGSQPLDIVSRSGADFDSNSIYAQMDGPNRFAFQMRNLGAPVQVPLGRMGGMNLDLTELPEPLGTTTPKDGTKPKELGAEEFAARAEKELEGCNRPGAAWIRTGLRFAADQDLEAFLAAWRRLRTAEEAGASSEDSAEDPLQAAISEELLWYETDVLFRLDRREEALAAARRLMENATLGPTELNRLVAWFSRYRQTELLGELAETRKEAFLHNPLQLYRIAEGLKKSGDEERAEALAEKALRLSPSPMGNAMFHHLKRLETAVALRERGLIPWAEREMQSVVEQSPPRGRVALDTWRLLSNLQFEDDRPLDAAKSLDKLLESDENRVRVDPMFRQFQASRDYFYARHYEKTGNRAKEREHLLKAVETKAEESPMWVDILIAAWQMEDLPDDVRKDVKTRVEAMLASDLLKINAKPNDPGNCNNYAWLAANTKLGDLQRAIAVSKRSVEIEKDNYAYWDTLAHCHHAAGDLENAVKCQAKAAELAPHCKIITSKLALFQKELDAAKGRKAPEGTPTSPDSSSRTEEKNPQ